MDELFFFLGEVAVEWVFKVLSNDSPEVLAVVIFEPKPLVVDIVDCWRLCWGESVKKFIVLIVDL